MNWPDWISIAIAAVALLVGWLSYRATTSRRHLEYVVTSNQLIINQVAPAELEVLLHGAAVADPALASVRIANTGNTAIRMADYQEPTAVVLEGVGEVMSASVTATRPSNIEVATHLRGNRVLLDPVLLNPADLVELQFLTSGCASDIRIDARIEGVTPHRIAQLPYPPGSGHEGEMLRFDRFMWWAVAPAILLAIFALPAMDDNAGSWPVIAWPIGIAASVLGAYVLLVRWLVRRRRIWRP